jgi:hypothetical protein
MMKTLVPYYLSRAILAALVGWILSTGMGVWVGVGAGLLAYAGFLWYVRSGRYLVDTSHPLTPLRRDARGKKIRDRSLVLAVGVGGLFFALATLLSRIVDLPGSIGSWAVLVGVLVYFGATNWYFLRQ